MVGCRGGRGRSGSAKVRGRRPLTVHAAAPRAGGPDTLGDVCHPVERFLAGTGRRDGGWDRARFRCRRIGGLTASWMMAAMVRSAPRRHKDPPDAGALRKLLTAV